MSNINFQQKWSFELKKPEQGRKLRDPFGFDLSTTDTEIVFLYENIRKI